MKQLLMIALFIFTALQLSAQTQSWQWIKAGGSNTDNVGNKSAQCRIGGCDAKGNVYAEGAINGPNAVFDTFTSAGTYGNVYINLVAFSYDCSGNMRWAKQIGDNSNAVNPYLPGIVTDIEGNTYIFNTYLRGFHIGDTIIDAGTPNNYFTYFIKLDSLGKIVWVRKYNDDYANAQTGGIVYPFGMRIGSSGHIWMGCNLDSNYTFGGTLHTTKQGKYQVEVDPATGNILGGVLYL
jgi:hypothetical protein